MKKLILLFTIGLLSICACGKQADTGSTESTKVEQIQQDTIKQEETRQEEAKSTEAQEETTTENIEITEAEKSFFAELPEEFFFSSGAGAWRTELKIKEDGSFYGLYQDSDMGTMGEEYPNGTVYICEFEGKFTEPSQVSEYVYSTTIEYMNTLSPAEDYIKDGVKYIVSTPYGLENAGEIWLYLYGASYGEMTEEFLAWVPRSELGPESLRCYAIYNKNEQTVFTGVKQEAYEELCKLMGSYQNEAGDRVDIMLSSELNEYTYELGLVEWMPHDRETERGTIVKNAIGGFTICLEDSIQYNFEMTKYESGSVEFSGVDEWSEHFGTFVMQQGK